MHVEFMLWFIIMCSVVGTHIVNSVICLCTQTQVSCNHEPHLRGNVYVQYLRQVCSATLFVF